MVARSSIVSPAAIPSMRLLVTLAFLGLATTSAPGQTEFTKWPDNPVIGPAPPLSWEIESYSPCVIYDGDQAVYRMWYAGYEGPGLVSIGYAESDDGISWERRSSPVVPRGEAGDLNDCYADKPWVIRRLRDGAPLYEMWFTAGSTKSDCKEFHILRAETDDPKGIEDWTIFPPEPVLQRGPHFWDSVAAVSGAVVFDETAPEGQKYRMLYSGFNGHQMQIGLAESEDGIVWNKSPHNPVLRPPSTEEDAKSMALLLRENVLQMWYTSWRGGTNFISYATSLDGIHWTKWPANPVLRPAQPWEVQSVFAPVVIVHDQPQILDEEPLVYKMWYSGRLTVETNWHIGYAEAPWIVPFVHFTAIPVVDSDGLEILFDASSTVEPNDTEISSYLWEFGDGATETTDPDNPAVVHRYTKEGEYLAMVTVTYNEFKEHSATLKVEVARTPISNLFIRSDCNDDGEVDISDVIAILWTLFLEGGDFSCEDACDSNDDGATDISDVIATLEVLFLEQGMIPFPGMETCGVDPSDDDLTCEQFSNCGEK